MTRTTYRARLNLDPLEARHTPAGVVDVTFADGSLTLVGDAADNRVTLAKDFEGGVVVGDVVKSTKFRLNGAAPEEYVSLPADITGTEIVLTVVVLVISWFAARMARRAVLDILGKLSGVSEDLRPLAGRFTK